MGRHKMVPVIKRGISIDSTYSRVEALAKLGLMSPQILSPDEVRELSRLVLEEKSRELHCGSAHE
jgi:hypothetical protein